MLGSAAFGGLEARDDVDLSGGSDVELGWVLCLPDCLIIITRGALMLPLTG